MLFYKLKIIKYIKSMKIFIFLFSSSLEKQIRCFFLTVRSYIQKLTIMKLNGNFCVDSLGKPFLSIFPMFIVFNETERKIWSKVYL